MDDNKKIGKIEKLNIDSIDITKIIIITPEVPINDIEQLFENDKITLDHVGGSLYLIEAKNVKYEDFEKIQDEISDIIEKIRAIQIGFYDSTEGRKKISFPDHITKEVATFIVEVNKKSNYDVDKVALVLQNILGGIYDHPEIDNKFMDRNTIEYLAKASVSKIMDEAQLNLTEALREILINIRKLYLAWIFDQCNISIINYRTDKKEVPIIQKSDLIKIENRICQKISLPQRWGDRLDILYEASSNSILTSNFGKDKQKIILPFVYLTVFDQILFHIRLETHEIEKRALENVERSVFQDLNKIDVYDKTSIKDLEKYRDSFVTAVEYFTKFLNNQVNQLRTQNRLIKRYYSRDYTRALSNQLMRGPISKSIFAITPLRNIDELDLTTNELNNMANRFSTLSGYVNEKINELIVTKKENNPKGFNKIKNDIRDFLIDLMAKYGAEISKP